MSDNVKYQWVDAAKGLAMLGVMGIHVAQRVSGLNNDAIFVFAFGAMGVQLFFMMSAYTACMSYQKAPHVAWKDYVIRRFMRLCPLYWLAIALYGSWSYLAQTHSWPAIFGSFASYTTVNVIWNITLLNTFNPQAQNAIVPGGWSISCIAVFYLFFPWLYRMLSQGKWLRVGALLLFNFCAAAILLCMKVLPKEFIYFSIVNQLSVFVIGMVIFMKPQLLKDCARRNAVTLGLGAVGGVLLVALAMKTLGQSYLYRHILVSFCFIPFLAILQKGEGHWPLFLVNLGKRSYSIFIVHFIFAWGLCGYIDNSLSWLSPYVRLPLYYGLTVLCSYALASLLDRYYEKPMLHIQKCFLGKKFFQ